MAVSRLALEGDRDLTGDAAAVRSVTHDADFGRMYAENSLRVIGLVRRFIADEDQVDDIVQEAFLRAYNAGLHLEYHQADGRDPWPWLAAVARNLSLDTLRKKQSLYAEDLEIDLTEMAVSPDDPELHHLASRRRDGIAEALDAVCPRQRRMLILKHIHGLHYQDIAEQEGMSVEALKSVLARARRTFREAYAAIAERSGLGVVLGGAFAKAQSKLRALRNRVTTAPDALAQAMAASPAAASTLTTLAVLGAAGVVGFALGSDAPRAPTPPPIASVAPEPAPVAIASTTPISGVDVAPAPAPTVEATVEPAPSEPTIEATPSPAPAATAPPSGGTQVEGSVDTDEVVPVEDPPAGASAQGSVSGDEDGLTMESLREIDSPSEGENDLSDGQTSVGVECPPPDERGLVKGALCPALEDSSML